MMFGQKPRPHWDRQATAGSSEEAQEATSEPGQAQADCDLQALSAGRIAGLGRVAEKLLADSGCPQLERRGVSKSCPLQAVLLAADLKFDVGATGEEVQVSTITDKKQIQRAKELLRDRLLAAVSPELLQQCGVTTSAQALRSELKQGTQLRQRHLRVLAAAVGVNIFLVATKQVTIDAETRAQVEVLLMGSFKPSLPSVSLHAISAVEQGSEEGGEMESDDGDVWYEVLQVRADGSRCWDCRHDAVRVRLTAGQSWSRCAFSAGARTSLWCC